MPLKRIAVGCPSPAPNTLEYLRNVVESNHYSAGKWVADFEQRFSFKFVGANHAIACNNGTAALHLALLALGIGEGDEVIVPATTFVATANAVRYVGATPIICDVDSDTWNLDIDQMKRCITPKTKAVIWVHLYGNPSGTYEMASYCRARGIYLIEDCAEAIGAWATDIVDFDLGGNSTLMPKAVGMIGDIAAFSFYGNKTITCGEGGMVVTDDKALAEKARFYRGQGQDPSLRFWHTDVGYNYRMTDLQAALGCAQLEIVDDLLEKRRVLDTLYGRLLHGKVEFQEIYADCTSGYWAFGCLLPDGVNIPQVQAMLELDGIETRRFFFPINAMPMYKDCTPLGTPIANELFNRGIWLPLHAELSLGDVKFICESLLDAIEKVGHGTESYPEYS